MDLLIACRGPLPSPEREGVTSHNTDRGTSANTELATPENISKKCYNTFSTRLFGICFKSVMCAPQARYFVCCTMSPEKMQQRLFSKSLEPSKAQFFFAYLLLPENFWSPVRPKILLTYCYRKIFGAQQDPKFCLPTATGKFLEPSKAENFAYLLLPENFCSPVRPKILLTYCYRKIFGTQ